MTAENASAETALTSIDQTERVPDETSERGYLGAFNQMVGDLRLAQAAITSARPTADEVDLIRAHLQNILAVCQPREVGHDDQVAGQVWWLPGRAQALVPPLRYDPQTSDDSTSGLVRFDRFHVGYAAVHGGCVAAVMDEAMGRLVGGRPALVRTAALTVNYRRLVPIDCDLRFEADVASQEGRKLWLTARMLDPAGLLLCDAEALFVETLGQNRMTSQ